MPNKEFYERYLKQNPTKFLSKFKGLTPEQLASPDIPVEVPETVSEEPKAEVAVKEEVEVAFAQPQEPVEEVKEEAKPKRGRKPKA